MDTLSGESWALCGDLVRTTMISTALGARWYRDQKACPQRVRRRLDQCRASTRGERSATMTPMMSIAG